MTNSNLSNCLNSKMQASFFEPPITKMNPLCARVFISKRVHNLCILIRVICQKYPSPIRGMGIFRFVVGFEPIKCNSPVDCCLPPARRRQLHNLLKSLHLRLRNSDIRSVNTGTFKNRFCYRQDFRFMIFLKYK